MGQHNNVLYFQTTYFKLTLKFLLWHSSFQKTNIATNVVL